jgi:MFS family permease
MDHDVAGDQHPPARPHGQPARTSTPAPSRTAAWLAWSICAACVAGTIGGIVLAARNRHLDSGQVLAVVLLTYPLVGALIAARQPRNPIGWELCALGLCFTLQFSSDPYARYALLTSPGSLPGAVAVALVGGLTFAPIFVLTVVLLPLSFPTGRLLGPRWRLVAAAGLAFMLLALVGNGLHPDNLVVSGVGTVRSPVAVPAAWTPLLDRLVDLAALLLIPSIGGAVAAVVVRFRRARGVERQQLKWYSYAAALIPVPFIAHDLLPLPVYITLFIVVLPLLPISIGIAIGRYRLYEIDRIINRTVVYTLLTAILGAGYAGVVLGLTQLFGGTNRPPPSWAVAGATLAAAAAFRPARRRVQAAVDRRFNRRRYNAARTIEAFVARLRQQIDLDALTNELLAVVAQTMQPTQASLWLRQPGPKPSPPAAATRQSTPHT